MGVRAERDATKARVAEPERIEGAAIRAPSYQIKYISCNNRINKLVSRFTVAEWLNDLACNVKGDAFAPHLRWYFRNLFLESIVSGT